MAKRSKKGKLYRYEGFTGGIADSRAGAKALLRKDQQIFGDEELGLIEDMDDYRIRKVEDSSDRPDGERYW